VLSAKQKLVALAVGALVISFSYFLAMESKVFRRARNHVAALQPSDVVAVAYNGREIRDPAEESAVLSALQQSHWKLFQSRLPGEQRTLILKRTDGRREVFDLHFQPDGRVLVEYVVGTDVSHAQLVQLAGENEQLAKVIAGFQPPMNADNADFHR
jgi:hypothetical protein